MERSGLSNSSTAGTRIREIVVAGLRAIPGVGRLRSLRPGADAQVGVLVEAFTAFAMLDGSLSPVEAELILDMFRSAFPEVDHTWLGRRMQRAVRNPQPLQLLAAELKGTYGSAEKLSLGLQLFTLVDAAGRSDRNRASFEVFMRRLGKPEFGTAILREMTDDGPQPADDELPFEKLVFGHAGAEVTLPPEAAGHEFRVYRTAELILVRNTGEHPLWIRGHSVKTGSFLRMRKRQPLVLPGWELDYDDLAFFLDDKRTGHSPAIYLTSSDASGLSAEQTRSRQSVLRIQFGLEAKVTALHDTRLHVGERGSLSRGDVVSCKYYERLGGEYGFNLTLNELREMATQSGRRFRLTGDRQEYLVSNDAAALARGDILLGPGLAPRTVLFIHYDARRALGELEVRESHGQLLVDDVVVRDRSPLADGSVIRLSGTQAIRCRFKEGFIDEERTLIESIDVNDLIHDFNQDSRALDHINFEVKRGEMLCIIGPSGSGKSTLLAVLSGQREPTRGTVRLNGYSLYDNRKRLVPFIAHMPQEEALNPQLTVREHLRHAVTIRRPALSLAEHERRVDSLLAELGLQKIANRQVGSAGDKTISGGERSRLNLGLDLVSRAEVFLFDEPISGLSSKDSEHVATTLRSLAREKIVIASLHRPGAPVLRLFDKVLLLDVSGRIAYFGTPVGMVDYFREACADLDIPHPGVGGDIPLGADFVFDVLETPLSTIGGGETGTARRFPPSFWQERFESADLMNAIERGGHPLNRWSDPYSDERPPLPPKPKPRVRAAVAVFATHFLRTLVSKLRSRGALSSTLLEAPILAALVSNTLRASPQGSYEFTSALHIPAYLFLSATVAMFLGLTNSATEILRDRPILRRERNCQPGAVLYISAKFAALAIVSAVQCITYIIVGNHFLEIEGMIPYYWLWMTLTAWTGTALALVVSSVVKTERAALTSVPLLLVPQMLLAGALVPYREMNHGLFKDTKETRERGGVPVPATIMPLRYAYEGMVVSQAVRNPFEIERIRLQRRIDSFRNSDDSKSATAIERFEITKEGLRRLLASGATNKKEAAELVRRIRRLSRSGSRIEVESIKVWPDDEKNARPASEFFVNERIDLIVREAETFRNDYRNTKPRIVFHSLKKPLPWAGEIDLDETTARVRPGEIETQKYCGIILIGIILLCLSFSSTAVHIQNRRTR